MPVVVVATIRPLAEHRAEVVAAYQEAVAAVHEEDGCTLYALHEADDRLVMIEQWESPEALKAHSTGPALQALGARLAGKTAVPAEVITMTAVPAGDAEKGQLR
jgi:quinol monooxygenase YgiN